MNLNNTHIRIRWVTFLILILATGFLLVLDSTGNTDTFYNFLEDPLSNVLELTNAPAVAIRKLLAGPEDIQAAQLEIDTLRAQLEVVQRENEELESSLREGRLNCRLQSGSGAN
jgi:cell shape-determining protein MreC